MWPPPPDAARHANRRMLELSGQDTETLFQRFGSAPAA